MLYHTHHTVYKCSCTVRPLRSFNGFFQDNLGKSAPEKQNHSGKTNLYLLEQEIVSGSGISWAICKSAPRSRQITMPAPHHSVFCRPDTLPATQPTASKHWRMFFCDIKDDNSQFAFKYHGLHGTTSCYISQYHSNDRRQILSPHLRNHLVNELTYEFHQLLVICCPSYVLWHPALSLSSASVTAHRWEPVLVNVQV